jgi:hypothetical protein
MDQAQQQVKQAEVKAVDACTTGTATAMTKAAVKVTAGGSGAEDERSRFVSESERMATTMATTTMATTMAVVVVALAVVTATALAAAEVGAGVVAGVGRVTVLPVEEAAVDGVVVIEVGALTAVIRLVSVALASAMGHGSAHSSLGNDSMVLMLALVVLVVLVVLVLSLPLALPLALVVLALLPRQAT